MRLEFYPVQKLRQEIKNIVGKYLDTEVWKVFFFGSRVKGDNFLSSDIDIGIEGPTELPPKIKFEISEEIEKIPTLYTFDLVDFKSLSDEFRKETLRYIEYV